MSTLNIDNYENHRPKSLIYQNLEIVNEGPADRTNLVLIGATGIPTTEDGLLYITNLNDVYKKLNGGSETIPSTNILANAAVMALTAGGGDSFYCIKAESGTESTVVTGPTSVTKNITSAGQDYYFGTTTTIVSATAVTTGVGTAGGGTTVTTTTTKVVKYTDTGMQVSSTSITDDPVTTTAASGVVNGVVTTTTTTEVICGAIQANGGYKQTTNTTVVKKSIAGDNEASANYTSAIRVLSNNDRTMFVVPLTYDLTLQKLVKSAVTALSTEGIQKWKRCYCPVQADPVASKDVIQNSTTPSAIAATIAAMSSGTSAATNQRVVNVWCPGAYIATTDNNGSVTTTILNNLMVTAGIAALRASILPQQGLSRKTISWIYNIPNAYIKFDQASLDAIAVSGCFIITQDDEDGDCYVRHQLTTDLTRGVLYYEDSVGVNVDTICYGLKDIVAPYIGQYNNTDQTLTEIRNRVVDYLLSLTNTGISADERRIGPQISSVDLESIVVKLDDNFKDRVIIGADIVVPLPLNQIHVHLNAFASLAVK